MGTFEDVQGLLGAKMSHISKHLNETLLDSVYGALDGDVPESFDARQKWEGLIHPIRDQSACGSCWAFSASEVLSDRVAIASGKSSPVLSAKDLVSCDKSDEGCNGGMLPHAWHYLVGTGIVTDTCMPYTAGGGRAERCPTKCVDSESFTRTHAQSSYAIHGAANMQKDIMMHGPIQVAFNVFKSFVSYHGGIYHKLKREKTPEGGHAVKMVGWGADPKAFWLVANSWGVSWGEDGFFRILRGKNECGIEEEGPPYAGLPASVAEDF